MGIFAGLLIPPISAKIGANRYVLLFPHTSRDFTSCIMTCVPGLCVLWCYFLAAACGSLRGFVPEWQASPYEEINGLFKLCPQPHKSYSYNRQIRQLKDRQNQQIIKAGGVAKMGAQYSWMKRASRIITLELCDSQSEGRIGYTKMM